ncbi:phospholipase A2 AP-PLA2-I-like [Antedon mediterranea]|uniref:phospholipase A2 AP-PLA2-I-like n=1 Tax=Antedon mediterranea TaxID=105859 RepID=UPI003AF47920
MFSSFLVLVFVCLSTCSALPGNRHRRSLGQMSDMIMCTTGRSAFYEYNGYGCYCGFGGSGDPIDNTDRCCKRHDRCYEKTDSSEGGPCYRLMPYATNYRYNTRNCQSVTPEVECASASAYSSWYEWLYRDCAIAICKCDRQLALCFASASNSYNPSHVRHDKSQC